MTSSIDNASYLREIYDYYSKNGCMNSKGTEIIASPSYMPKYKNMSEEQIYFEHLKAQRGDSFVKSRNIVQNGIHKEEPHSIGKLNSPLKPIQVEENQTKSDPKQPTRPKLSEQLKQRIKKKVEEPQNLPEPPKETTSSIIFNSDVNQKLPEKKEDDVGDISFSSSGISLASSISENFANSRHVQDFAENDLLAIVKEKEAAQNNNIAPKSGQIQRDTLPTTIPSVKSNSNKDKISDNNPNIDLHEITFNSSLGNSIASNSEMNQRPAMDLNGGDLMTKVQEKNTIQSISSNHSQKPVQETSLQPEGKIIKVTSNRNEGNGMNQSPLEMTFGGDKNSSNSSSINSVQYLLNASKAHKKKLPVQGSPKEKRNELEVKKQIEETDLNKNTAKPKSALSERVSVEKSEPREDNQEPGDSISKSSAQKETTERSPTMSTKSNDSQSKTTQPNLKSIETQVKELNSASSRQSHAGSERATQGSFAENYQDMLQSQISIDTKADMPSLSARLYSYKEGRTTRSIIGNDQFDSRSELNEKKSNFGGRSIPDRLRTIEEMLYQILGNQSSFQETQGMILERQNRFLERQERVERRLDEIEQMYNVILEGQKDSAVAIEEIALNLRDI